MRKLLFIVSCSLAPFFSDAQFMYKGLGGIITNQLTIESDTIFASTSNGLYKKSIYSNDTL
jgi:hypothetical protein